MIAKYSATNINDKAYMNAEPRKNVDKFNLRTDTYLR